MIKNARIAACLTQKELALKIGTTAQVISRYEVGEQEPTASRLRLIAKILGVKMEELF